MDFAKAIKDYYAREVKAIEDLDISELNKAVNCFLDHYEKESTIFMFKRAM